MIKKLKIKRFNKNKAYIQTKFGDAIIDKNDLKNYKQNDKVELYIYFDKDNTLRASKNLDLENKKVYSLKCIDIKKNGAYFLYKDKIKLLMPASEKTYRVIKDMTYPVGIMFDEQNMPIATSKIRDFLSTNHNFKENDIVEGRIYSINKHIGAFVAINNQFDSLIRMKELKGIHIEGELLKVRIKEVRDDGKIELSSRKRSYLEIDSDCQKILDFLEENDGMINLGDKSSPDKIYKTFGFSKSAYKRAIGRLHKDKYIKIYPKKIKLLEM